MKDIYIVLSRSHTPFALAIRGFTRKYYNHTSIAFDKSLTPIYSFGRHNPRLMFPAGFITESVNTGFFGIHPKTRICVLKFSVTAVEYDVVEKRLNPFIHNSRKYKYGLKQMCKMVFGKTDKPKYNFVCSVFVAFLLRGILPFQKDYTLTYPEDFLDFNLTKVYEGTAGEYRYD